jgi:hypothetical protein
LPWISEFTEFNSKSQGDSSMLKKALLLAGVALALATVGSANIPTPPCSPCLLQSELAR